MIHCTHGIMVVRFERLLPTGGGFWVTLAIAHVRAGCSSANWTYTTEYQVRSLHFSKRIFGPLRSCKRIADTDCHLQILEFWGLLVVSIWTLSLVGQGRKILLSSPSFDSGKNLHPGPTPSPSCERRESTLGNPRNGIVWSISSTWLHYRYDVWYVCWSFLQSIDRFQELCCGRRRSPGARNCCDDLNGTC